MIPKLLPATFSDWHAKDVDRPVAMMMSGGVDSSVSAALLRDQGWDVVGITMKIPTAEACDHPRPCCGAEAAIVCDRLGLPHYFVDVEAAFNRFVIEPFQEDYRIGRTPSPCVDCNTAVKFGIVWDVLRSELGVDHLATGHYAQVVEEKGDFVLSKGGDPDRDQSYFLYGVQRERLPFLHFPLGESSKDAVRRLAAGHGLEVADRPDSMELCFAGEGDYRNALSDGPLPGRICNSAGEEIGTHSGIHNYTIGQRKGLGGGSGEPLYVLQILPKQNLIVAGTREEAYASTVTASGVNVLLPKALATGVDLLGKVRSTRAATPCVTQSWDGRTVQVVFEKPVFAPAPGQHLVLYDVDGRVIAGGVIDGGVHAACSSVSAEVHHG